MPYVLSDDAIRKENHDVPLHKILRASFFFLRRILEIVFIIIEVLAEVIVKRISINFDIYDLKLL